MRRRKDLLKSVNESWRAAIAFFSIKAKTNRKCKSNEKNRQNLHLIIIITLLMYLTSQVTFKWDLFGPV